LCATARSSVHEYGMAWALNGRTQATQAWHDEGCRYVFHGSYNPVKDGAHVSYADFFAWRIPAGTATLQLYGNFVATGTHGGPCRQAGPFAVRQSILC